MNIRGWFRPKANLPQNLSRVINLPHPGIRAVNPSTVVRLAAVGSEKIPSRALKHKNLWWYQGSPDSAKGTARFVREVVVDGRAAESEIEVALCDLEPQSDGTFCLRGR